MHDIATFYRHSALACFHRRRRWPFLSGNWQHEVEDARQFIKYFRAEWKQRSSYERRATQMTRSAWALGSRVAGGTPDGK